MGGGGGGEEDQSEYTTTALSKGRIFSPFVLNIVFKKIFKKKKMAICPLFQFHSILPARSFHFRLVVVAVVVFSCLKKGMSFLLRSRGHHRLIPAQCLTHCQSSSYIIHRPLRQSYESFMNA